MADGAQEKDSPGIMFGEIVAIAFGAFVIALIAIGVILNFRESPRVKPDLAPGFPLDAKRRISLE